MSRLNAGQSRTVRHQARRSRILRLLTAVVSAFFLSARTISSSSSATSASLKTPRAAAPGRKKKHVVPPESVSTVACSTAAPSTVPTASTFQFHPLLPSTPLLKSSAAGYRKPRRNESIVMSLNGSPLRLDDLLRRMGGKGLDDAEGDGDGAGGGGGGEEGSAAEEAEGAEDNEDDAGLGLLDEEEVMRQMEGAKGAAGLL